MLRYDEALPSERLPAREMIVEMDHPLMGRVRPLGRPAQFGASRTGAYDKHPEAGQ